MYSDPKQCLYCTNNETLHNLMIEIASLSVSRVFLFKEQTYRGRCLVAYNGHVNDLNELSDEKREESLKKQINELNKIIDTVAISHKDVLKEKYGLNLSIFSGWEEWDEATKNLRDELIKQLSEIEDAKKKIAVPTKIDVELAKDKYEQSKDQLSYLSNFAVAMKNPTKTSHILLLRRKLKENT